MKKAILTIMLTMIMLSNVSALDIESMIQEETSGGSSLLYGGYAAIGFQSGIDDQTQMNIRGLQLEGGGYLLFNAINKVLDIELGISGKLNPGLKTEGDSNSETKYYSGLLQASIYCGPVFQFDGGHKALGLGISKALYLDAVRSSDADENNIPEYDLSNGLGAYLEFQWISQSDSIYFTRLEVEKFDIEAKEINLKDEQIVAGLIFGMKFK